MKILIIGGTRFIGRHLVPELLEAGHRLTLLNRGTRELPWPKAPIQQLQGDRNELSAMRDRLASEHFDAIIDMILYDEVQAKDAIAALQGITKHYLMLSTRSVYAPPHLSPIHETDPLEQRPEVAYGYQKAAAETVLMNAWHQSGFPATILRLPAIYGEYDYQIRERYFIKRLLDQRPHILLPEGGAGTNQREYAGNIAAQLTFLLTKPESIGKVYNSGHARVQTYRSMVEDAMKIMNQTMTLYSIPAPLFPAIPDLAWPIVDLQSVAKLEALGWVEKYSPYVGLERTIAWQRTEPLNEYLPTHRNQRQHFDYAKEDALIAALGVRL